MPVVIRLPLSPLLGTWSIDNEDPVISTSDVSGDKGCGDPGTPSFSGADNCDGPFSPNVDDGGGPTITGCSYEQTWTATYTNACGNPAAPVSITWTWSIDNEDPVISTSDVSGDKGCGDPGTPSFSGADNCDGPFSPNVDDGGGPTITGCSYEQTWTATYTDACGNPAAPVSITWTWSIDNEDPVISTSDVSGDKGCGDPGTPSFSGADNCDGPFSPNVDDGGGPTITGCSYEQTWTATYTDACGNPAAPVSITWTWSIDNEDPVISTSDVSGDKGCGDPGTPSFSGADNCDGPFSPNVDDGGGPTITGCSYEQTWTATYTDACGNPAAPVSITWTWSIDNNPTCTVNSIPDPGIICNSSWTVPDYTSYVNVSDDNCSTVTTTQSPTAGTIVTMPQGGLTITFYVADNCGNSTCEVVIPCSIQQTPTYCTYTVGYWGNHPELVLSLMGCPAGSTCSCTSTIALSGFNLTPECIDNMLPGNKICGNGNNIDYCSFPFSSLNNFEKNLVRQAIGMKLNFLSSPNLASQLIDEIYCHDTRLDPFLGMTVAQLLNDAEACISAILSGNTCPNRGSLTNALGAISVLFDECASVSVCPPPVPFINIPNQSSNLDEEQLAEVLYLQPNPATNHLEVNYKTSNDEPVQIRIFDFKGNLIYNEKVLLTKYSTTHTIGIKSLPSGIYVLQILDQKRQVSRKFVKSRR